MTVARAQVLWSARAVELARVVTSPNAVSPTVSPHDEPSDAHTRHSSPRPRTGFRDFGRYLFIFFFPHFSLANKTRSRHPIVSQQLHPTSRLRAAFDYCHTDGGASPGFVHTATWGPPPEVRSPDLIYAERFFLS